MKDWAPTVVLIAVVVFQFFTIQGMKGQVRDVGLRADSIEAANDTTRLIGDQYRRRAIQTELERDSLAKVLEERPVVTTTVVIDPEPVVDTVEVTTQGDTILTSSISDDTMVASVTFRLLPPHEWIAEWEIDVKPVKVTVGVRCGPLNEATGVFPVQVTVETELSEVEIEDSEVDPALCNPPPPEEGRSFWKGLALGALIVLIL